MNAFAFRFKCVPATIIAGPSLLLRQLGATQQDLGDPDGGQQLAVADPAARILAAALLESDDGAVLALFDDFRRDHGAIDERRAESHVLALAMREHLADLDDFADL